MSLMNINELAAKQLARALTHLPLVALTNEIYIARIILAELQEAYKRGAKSVRDSADYKPTEDMER